MTSWKIAARLPRKTSRSPNLRSAQESHNCTPGHCRGILASEPDSRNANSRPDDCADQSGRGGRDQKIARTCGFLDFADLAVEPDFAAGEQPQRIGIDPVFD